MSAYPCGITARQAQMLDAMCEVGNAKTAAAKLGISDKTASTLLHRAKARMGSRTRLLLILEWDRLKQRPETGFVAAVAAAGRAAL